MFAGDGRVSVVKTAFSRLGQELGARGWWGRVDGLLLDLGVSSPQLDDPDRGFSFMQDGRLDMRMDPTSGIDAAKWLVHATEQEMAQVFKEYGEERYARRIAQAIVEARRREPITTTGRLASTVSRAVPTREPGKHPATRTFQALRIYLNRELEELAACLAQVPQALAPFGRLVVISFHSLEDRLVKRFIRDQSRGDAFPSDLPVLRSQLKPRLRSVAGPVYPSPEEVAANPRARSAVMRVAEKLP
jgi:16S rRNA (cytosine1402-N4)-methyltransferase